MNEQVVNLCMHKNTYLLLKKMCAKIILTIRVVFFFFIIYTSCILCFICTLKVAADCLSKNAHALYKCLLIAENRSFSLALTREIQWVNKKRYWTERKKIITHVSLLQITCLYFCCWWCPDHLVPAASW